MSDSSRATVYASIRRALGSSDAAPERRAAVAARLAGHPRGVIPARGQLPPDKRLVLFKTMVEAAAGTLDLVADGDAVPAAVTATLRRHNLPMAVRMGEDARLAAMPWNREGTLEVTRGASDGDQLAAVSHAFAGVAETGTLVLTSGADNPTTLNFLPDTHIVVIDAADVDGDLESVWDRLRARFGVGTMPRAVNFITGPSRSADIEQTLILGAHGPRRLHVIVTGAAGADGEFGNPSG